MPQTAVGIFVHNIAFGKSCLAGRAPVDQPFGPVEESLLPKLNERFAHRARKPFIHGKSFMAPIAGNAQGLQLMQNSVASLLLPLPDRLNELFPAQLSAAAAPFG